MGRKRQAIVDRALQLNIKVLNVSSSSDSGLLSSFLGSWGSSFVSSISWNMSGGIGGGWSVGRLLVLVGILSMSVHKLDTHLLGQGQLDGLTGGGSQLGDALLEGLDNILNLGDGDTLLGGQILAADSGQRDGLVDTGLDGLGVGDLNGGLDNGDNGDVVASLLGHLLAVVVTVSTI